MEKIKLIMAILYILSPVDIIPEVLLGPFGLIDDGMALIYVLSYFLGEEKGNKKSKNNYKQVSVDYGYNNQVQNDEETIVVTEKIKNSNTTSWLIGILFLGVIGVGAYYYIHTKNQKKYYTNINRNNILNSNISGASTSEEIKYVSQNDEKLKQETIHAIMNENTIDQSKHEQSLKSEEISKKKLDKYNGSERDQFIILKGEEVYIDENGNIIRE